MNKTYFDHIEHKRSQSRDENHEKSCGEYKNHLGEETVNVLSSKMISNNLNYIFALLKIEFIRFELFFPHFLLFSSLYIRYPLALALNFTIICVTAILFFLPFMLAALLFRQEKRQTNKFLLLFFCSNSHISYLQRALQDRKIHKRLKICCWRHRCVLFCCSTTCERKNFFSC